MKAYILKEICEIKVNENYRQTGNLPLKSEPLKLVDVPVPQIEAKDILIKVLYCGICRTELDQIEGRIPPPMLPVILGHQIVGIVEDTGYEVSAFKSGDKVGVGWIYSTCGICRFCLNGEENLCSAFQATGCNVNGGYAQYMKIPENFACKIPNKFTDFTKVAPLLCGGVIGFRSLKLTGMKDGKILSLYGFGSANHQVLQCADFLFPNSKKFVFSRNPAERKLAEKLGATWTGDFDTPPLEKSDYAIDTTPAWKVTIKALEYLEKGGRLVINLIRKENADKNFLLTLDYTTHLWKEKEIKSVANITRTDIEEFLPLAAEIPIIPETQVYDFTDVNKALIELKSGKKTGSKVLKIPHNSVEKL